MARTYHDAPITAAQMDKVLASMNSVSKASNNGKILCVDDFGFLTTKTQQELHIGAVLEPVTIRENGTVTPPEGVDGFDSVTVDVSGPAPVLQNKIVTQNGVVTPDTGYDGLGQVTVDVPGGGYPEPTGTIPITANGTVNVKDYASAEVNVPTGITAADEGKVVKNGVLVAQTARDTDITANGTYNTTENNSVTVNVSGGGGGGSNILYGSEEPLPAQGNNGDIFLRTVSSMNAVLPSGYQELPAIEGTGTQYIDTTISTAQAGLSVKANLAITGANDTSSSGGDGIWGGSWARNGYLMIRYGSSPGVFRWHYGGANTRDVPVTLNKWISLETNGTGMIIDGVTYPFAGGGANAQNTLTLFFVGSHATGTPGKMQLSRTKVSVDNMVLADFVPCKNSNNEVGMYDLIGQTFYGNSGTGSFLSVTENIILSAYLKTNGSWQDLIGSGINDVNL